MERIKLNLVPTGMVENVHASQYDIARTFRFDLMDGESVFTLDGTETITVDVTKPDGTQTTISVDNTSSSYVDVVTPAGVCDLSGSANCELRIVKGGEEIGSQNFSIKIESDPHDDKIVLRTASGIIASFNTDLGGIAVDVTSALPYNPNGYTSASAINSKTPPVFDLAPYLTRANTNTGNLALEKLVGLTVCFNQLIPDASMHQTGTGTGNWQLLDQRFSLINNHVYLCLISGTFDNDTLFRFRDIPSDIATDSVNGSFIYKSTVDTNNTTGLQPKITNGASYDYYYNVIDLTAMFGSEVADYLYTLESGTAGAGVSIFKSLFGADYYPYTANTLMSAKPTGKKIVGKNFFNGEYEELYELPFVLKKGTVVTASCVQTTADVSYIYYYDKDGNLIDYWGMSTVISGNHKYRTFTIDNDCYYMRHYIAPANDVQVEIGSTATAYEPYSETTIVYSGNELRGLLKVGTNGLYADGDIDDGSGTSAVNYYDLDLGSPTWYYNSGSQFFYAEVVPPKTDGIAMLTDMIADIDLHDGETTSNNHSIQYYGDLLRIRYEEYTNESDFTTAMTGKHLCYKKATPTTATSTTWSNPIVAKQGGTETFVDNRTIALPTGHDTIYGTDLVVKKAEFGQTVYGGSVDFTTGEVISNKNADGTDKTAETIAISPVMVGVFEGNNNIVTTAGGNNTVKYYKGA